MLQRENPSGTLVIRVGGLEGLEGLEGGKGGKGGKAGRAGGRAGGLAGGVHFFVSSSTAATWSYSSTNRRSNCTSSVPATVRQPDRQCCSFRL